MEKKRILALFSILFMASSFAITFAEDWEWSKWSESRYEVHNSYWRETRNQESNEHKFKREKQDSMQENSYSSKNNRNINQKLSKQAKVKEIENNKIKFKPIIKRKFWKILDKMSKTKLETISIKIDTKLLEIDSNKNISEIKKIKIISILEALKEIIDEKLNNISSDSIINNLLK